MIIITDLDGTLAHSHWRKSLQPDWDAYFAASKEDKPNAPMVALINALGQTCRIICITARPEKWRQLTMNWLLKHKIGIDELIMRPADDYRMSPLLKPALAATLKNTDTIIVIDDRLDVILAYIAAGFTTLQSMEV